MREETYLWEPDMGEISGFGGEYERTCRAMLVAGLAWLAAHPDANPVFYEYKGIVGVLGEGNDDAKALSNAVVNAVEDCTEIMYHAVISACMFIKKNGWDGYKEKRKEATKRKLGNPNKHTT
jgi:hypothetical protein